MMVHVPHVLTPEQVARCRQVFDRAAWADGRLIADFPNLRLRDVDTLKIDRFDLSLYIASNTARENRKFHDDVVAATAYIGPKRDPASR